MLPAVLQNKKKSLPVTLEHSYRETKLHILCSAWGITGYAESCSVFHMCIIMNNILLYLMTGLSIYFLSYPESLTNSIIGTYLIDCRTVSLCSAALSLICSILMSLFSRSILALKIIGRQINQSLTSKSIYHFIQTSCTYFLPREHKKSSKIMNYNDWQTFGWLPVIMSIDMLGDCWWQFQRAKAFKPWERPASNFSLQ